VKINKKLEIMEGDLLDFQMPVNVSAIIKVLGVGGGGSNAVNHMYKQGITGVDFIVTNTDAQALQDSPVPIKVQLGATLTEGLGAGNQPEKGKEAAIESIEIVKKEIGEETRMIFITAGMGGGTGTGAAPVIAQASKDLGILTVGIVTLPFRYEGKKRLNQAIDGIQEMSKHVDSLLIINNEKLREIYGNFEARKALAMADEVLTVAAKGIAEIITKKGHVNVDFADVKTVMKDSGIALMGTGVATGDNRAEEAVKAALSSPLLDNNDIEGAGDILLNISSGTKEVTMDEISIINEYVQAATGNIADLIWGSSIDETLEESVAVTVIATGFKTQDINEIYLRADEGKTKESKTVPLEKEEPTPINEDIRFEVETTNDESKPKVKIVTLDDSVAFSEEETFIGYNSNNKNGPDNSLNTDSQIDVSVKTTVQESEPSYNNSNPPHKIRNYKSHIEELEDEPAYKRKNVDIDLDKDYDTENMSKYTMSTRNNDVFLGENNRFLHEKPD